MKKILLAAFLGLAFASTSLAQNSKSYWERLDKSHPVVTFDSLENLISADSSAGACRLSMIYDGQYRSISAEKLAVLKTKGYKKKELKHYQYEFLFKYKGEEIWLPVMLDLVEQFQLEMRQNESVVLYTTVFQTLETGNQKMLLVEDFKRDQTL